MQSCNVLYALVSIAAEDGVAISEVVERGVIDLKLRIAKRAIDAQNMENSRR